MNFPNCSQHPTRRVEIVCLTQDCPERLRLQCAACIQNSKCKKHQWKMVDLFIEEVFEVCETEQAKWQKKVKPPVQKYEPSSIILKHRQSVDQVFNEVEQHFQQLRKESMEYFKRQREELSSKLPELPTAESPKQQHFKTVKDNINQFRRSDNREIANLDTMLKSVHQLLRCDQEGVLTLLPYEITNFQTKNKEAIDKFEKVSQEHLQRLQNTAMKMMNSLRWMEQSTATDEPKETKSFDQQRQSLYSHIEELNSQIKQIPVLRQRIQDQAAKIETKNRKITEFEATIQKLQHNSTTPVRESHIREEAKELKECRDKEEFSRLHRSGRIQKLLETRDLLSKSAINHCRDCTKDTIKTYRLYPKEDALQTDFGGCSCQVASFINLSSLIVSDELNNLGHSDQMDQPSSITVTIINQRTPSPYKRKPYMYPAHQPYGSTYGSTYQPYRPTY